MSQKPTKQNSRKRNIKDLKHAGNMGYKDLGFWGLIGAISLVVFYLIVAIIGTVTPHVLTSIFSIMGLIVSILYAIIGVLGVIVVIKKTEGKVWFLFLIGCIFAILTPIGWFAWAGFSISLMAAIFFGLYLALEENRL